MTAAIWTYPNIDPVALQLGPLAIRWYGLAYLTGFVFAWLVLRRVNVRWKLGLSADDEVVALLAVVLGLVIGARLGYVLVYGAGAYWSQPLKIFALWDGGMSFHGGMVGLLVAGVYLSLRFDIPLLRLSDWGAIAAPLGLGLGRLANFVNGELWGRPSDLPWAMVFPGDPTRTPRHPSQLYEAVLEGAVLLTIILLLERRTRPAGELTGWFMLLYGSMRIFVEFFREPDAQMGFLFGGVTTGQLLSVPMVIAGVWIIWWVRRRARRSQKV